MLRAGSLRAGQEGCHTSMHAFNLLDLTSMLAARHTSCKMTSALAASMLAASLLAASLLALQKK